MLDSGSNEGLVMVQLRIQNLEHRLLLFVCLSSFRIRRDTCNDVMAEQDLDRTLSESII